MDKIKVGLLFGGKSSEHEVSLQSAKNIMEAIDHDKYDVTLVGIDKQGNWHLNNNTNYLINDDNPKLIELNKTNKIIAVVPGRVNNQILNINSSEALEQLDVIFPILHGPSGEDGSVQGMIRMANIPCVGPNVLSSAICMDKDIAKRLLQASGYKVADWVSVKKSAKNHPSFYEVKEKLGTPFFIKPANQGSSVGVSKARSEKDYIEGLKMAMLYDHKVLLEENVIGREIECGVLGNENPQASLPGEILPNGDFYSYETKYIDENGAVLKIPADLSEELKKKIQEQSIEAFEILECQGLARVDYFLKEDGSLVINEVNTLPGFTKISMYPKLWEISGIPYPVLIEKLIDLAIDRHKQNHNLKNSVD
ncbi:D-alanine--D-alanine ligase [Halobacillus sp. BAB-2008]|uniref:D-alanine--D-alanine ligase n=1 Tax=Halobacillus sp. BAB-2008 TaxID=1246484 RepID=UPI0002A4F2D7|nr:D-alanine--D-alanine ligase [Halobacillus sp. BAB-2008]ELK44139.1 D-alanyl-alanine synthetase A [Halobacillus sp. BAB-2008]